MARRAGRHQGEGYGHPEQHNTGWPPIPPSERRSERRTFFKDDAAPEGCVVEVFVDIVFEEEHANNHPWRWTTTAVVNEGGQPVAHVLGGWRVGSRTPARTFGMRTYTSFVRRAHWRL